MHAGADFTTSMGTSAGRPGWFLELTSSANTSPEQEHDFQKPTGQPPFDNLSYSNSRGHVLVPRGPYQWLTAHWAEISAKADAMSATVSTAILQDTPAQPEGLEAVILVVGPRTRAVATLALQLAQDSGISVQIGWAGRVEKKGVSTSVGSIGPSPRDERHPNGGGDDHPNGGGGEDEDCPNGRNDDGRGGNDRCVGRGRSGEGEGGKDGQEISGQRVYTSKILWGREIPVDQQFYSEVILKSDQTLPQPPKKTYLKLTINFSDSPQLQIRKGYLSMWTTKGQRLRGYPDGRGRSQTLIRPHYYLESIGNLCPGQVRLSASWTLDIQPGSEGRIIDDIPFDIHIIGTPLDLEQDFRMIIAYYITHRPNIDLPIDDSFILLHEISVSDLRKFPTDLHSLAVNHSEALTFQQQPTELASLVQIINLDGRQADNDITHSGLKLNLPVRPRNILRKLLQKIRQQAKISRILSEQTPLITVRANGRVDAYPFYDTLINGLLFESKII